MTPEELEDFREANRDRLDRIRPAVGVISSDRSASIRSRIKRRDERVMVDGHWYHPEAPHGTASGVQYFGCCCQRCRDFNNENKKAQRRAQKEQGGGLDRS
jgi:hypothetical protein